MDFPFDGHLDDQGTTVFQTRVNRTGWSKLSLIVKILKNHNIRQNQPLCFCNILILDTHMELKQDSISSNPVPATIWWCWCLK